MKNLELTQIFDKNNEEILKMEEIQIKKDKYTNILKGLEEKLQFTNYIPDNNLNKDLENLQKIKKLFSKRNKLIIEKNYIEVNDKLSIKKNDIEECQKK